MEPFVAQLATLCRAHPTRAKWVLVPSHAIGRTLGDRLARAEGGGWVNLRFVTPLDIALRMGAPFLVERGLDPSEEGIGPALVMRLLFDLPGARGYFRPLASQPAMAAALWATLRELRMAGISAADLPGDAFASADKHAELVALADAYERFLAATSRADRAMVFTEALAHLDWCPVQPGDCWTELPDTIWAPLERRLLDAVPGERLTPAAWALPDLAPPRRLAQTIVDRRDPMPVETLAFLTRPGDVAGHAEARPPELFHAGGCEAEVEEVIRRILRSGRSLDEVEIACASRQYSTLVWEKVLRHDWPVTVAAGIPAALTRPGRALLAAAEWIEDDFAAGRLRRLLQSGDIRVDDRVSMSAGRAARLLVKAEAAWGRDTYRLSLGRLAASSRRAAERSDLPADAREGLARRAAEAEQLADWIDALIRAVPCAGPDGQLDLQEIVAFARGFIDRSAARASALDAMAARLLSESIGELTALGAFRCRLDQALRFLRERVEHVSVGADRPRPGHLHVSLLATAGFAGRPAVFVVGLEEGRVFPASFEDPILLDEERARIDAGLVRSVDRTDEAVYAALVRLGAMSAGPAARVTLSYSCRDLRQYRHTYPSWVLLQAWRLASGRLSATFRDLEEGLGPPVSILPASPDEASSEGHWWLHGGARAGERALDSLLARYPSLGAGRVARAARASAVFTAFDGHVPAAGAVLDPANPGLVVSPTQLEEAATCPFRYFLRRGLGVDAVESGERDRDIWLDPLLRGSLLHDLYAALLRRCRTDNRRASERDDAWLRQQGSDLLAALAVEMPPPSAEVRERETELLLEDVSLFVAAEAALDDSRTPVGFEVSFGQRHSDARSGEPVEPLAQADPVVLDVGGGLTLRLAGRIDRIDRVGARAFEIIDYKTGSFWPDDWQGTFAGGRRLQHALYGLAAAELLRREVARPRVTGAAYYFASAKGRQERTHIPAPAGARVATVLADLREVIASGLFVHASDERACRWCDHGLACGARAAVQAAGKADDAVLAPYRRLGSHE